MKSFAYWRSFQRSNWQQVIRYQAVRYQAIIWTTVEHHLCRHMAPICHNELIVLIRFDISHTAWLSCSVQNFKLKSGCYGWRNFFKCLALPWPGLWWFRRWVPNQISMFLCFFILLNHRIPATSYTLRSYLINAISQLSCGDTCQIWTWFNGSARYFCSQK